MADRSSATAGKSRCQLRTDGLAANPTEIADCPIACGRCPSALSAAIKPVRRRKKVIGSQLRKVRSPAEAYLLKSMAAEHERMGQAEAIDEDGTPA